jgi:hypothetical protein
MSEDLAVGAQRQLILILFNRKALFVQRVLAGSKLVG